MDLNRATILGRLTQDPEVRTTPNGKSVASMSVATNRVWTDGSGTKQEKTEFHNCVLWGRLGEIAGQYLNKGRRVYAEGRIETRDWVGQDGVKRYRTELVIDNMIMLDGGPGGQGGRSGGNSTPAASPAASSNAPFPGGAAEAGAEEEIRVEDIPF
jgi:single-strand DNA-binding protein